MMKIAGWLLVVLGFAWIGFVRLANPLKTAARLVNQKSAYQEERNYSRTEVIDAMSRFAQSIEKSQLSPLPGGLAMLVGAVLLSRSSKTGRT